MRNNKGLLLVIGGFILFSTNYGIAQQVYVSAGSNYSIAQIREINTDPNYTELAIGIEDNLSALFGVQAGIGYDKMIAHKFVVGSSAAYSLQRIGITAGTKAIASIHNIISDIYFDRLWPDSKLSPSVGLVLRNAINVGTRVSSDRFPHNFHDLILDRDLDIWQGAIGIRYSMAVSQKAPLRVTAQFMYGFEDVMYTTLRNQSMRLNLLEVKVTVPLKADNSNHR